MCGVINPYISNISKVLNLWKTWSYEKATSKGIRWYNESPGEENIKEVAKMYYTGIDIHKKTSFITTIDKSGKIVFKGMQNSRYNRQRQLRDEYKSCGNQPAYISMIHRR